VGEAGVHSAIGNQLYNLEYSHDMGSQQRQLGREKCQEKH